ncbi:P-loop containing nucleoside triphosphate hydrolase protein [Mycena rosella]|uniref:P-loop containing nucleoside triphosphate hydrolase protein n=1 Tax=Mycena rosella TaxID=1033263 RepID=A0AAD7GRC2_MYCRO|nr:P-loop containing nucleoside triphosphate hydrolase protein [Mycena rosella]
MSYSNLLGGEDIGSYSSWLTSLLTSFMGLSSVFGALGMVSQSYLGSSIKLLILGSVIETGRRLFQWLTVRLRFQYSVTAQFYEGDPAYEWMILFLTQEGVWRSSRDFIVNATNSRRKWSVKTADPTIQGNAEYVPTYEHPQLFRWRGHWVEIRRNQDGAPCMTPFGNFQSVANLCVTIYTLNMTTLSELVEDARTRYVDVNRPNVVIHIADSQNYGLGHWNSVKHKVRRPLSSIILKDGVVDALVSDAQEFLKSEDWYVEAGIPHRRGYLLHGPPGTGKTSTIYALAGALNLEIYSLSLASSFVDDAFLQRAASSIPKHALFLIEDIDCAFASREEEDDAQQPVAYRSQSGRPVGMSAGGPDAQRGPRSLVSLSGLLNVIDGVGSEEGKLFFATTNYIDRLDPALLRPGRIDRKVAYELATASQAHALFLRFFPAARFADFVELAPTSSNVDPEIGACIDKVDFLATEKAKLPAPDSKTPQRPDAPTPDTPKAPAGDVPPREKIPALATAFAAAIPPGQFSTAELQCYLQAHKKTPAAAVAGARAWIAEQCEERRAREAREAARARKAKPDAKAKVDKVENLGRDDGAESPATSEFSYVDGSLSAADGQKEDTCTS